MSVLMEPRGPEPPMVYWLRRAAVILVAVTVVIALWWFLFGRSGSTETIQTATSTEVSAEATVDAVADPLEPQECSDDAITVRARLDRKSFPAGNKPELSMVIRNTGDVACLREVGPRANELKITSGGYHVWASKHCFTGKKSNVVLLDPGQRAETTLRWNGRVSKKGCPDKTAQAKPGSYELVAINGDVKSKAAKFSITKAKE